MPTRVGLATTSSVDPGPPLEQELGDCFGQRLCVVEELNDVLAADMAPKNALMVV